MDIKKLEGLETFAKFFDFLSNPEDYKATVEEARQAVKDFEAMTLKARQIQDVDVFRGETLAKLDAKEKALNAQKQSMEADYQSRVKAVQEIQDRLDKQGLENAARVNELNLREAAIENADLLYAQLDKERAEFESAKAAFAQKVSEFESQKARLDAVLKG
jgi:Tol biopolymer transport system component